MRRDLVRSATGFSKRNYFDRPVYPYILLFFKDIGAYVYTYKKKINILISLRARYLFSALK